MEKKRVKINSKDLKLILEVRVFSYWKYLPDSDLNKHPSEWKWVETPFDREKEMKNFNDGKWGDFSIYKYKDEFIQPISNAITEMPDYIDEKNNYYNVFDLLNDRILDHINTIPCGCLKERSEYGKRN